jgi:hypothetical protein
MNNLMGLLGGMGPQMMAMGMGGMPDLMNPAGAVTSPLASFSGYGAAAPMANPSLDPSMLTGPYLHNGRELSSLSNSDLMGIAGLLGGGQQTPPPRMAPAGGISRAQFGPMSLMPGASMMRR